MAIAVLPPANAAHAGTGLTWFSSNSASIAPGALIILLVESVLDSLFFGPAQQGTLSPWMQGGNQKQSKQSGQTHVVRSDFNGAGHELEHPFPRQLDGLVNVGLVMTLPPLKAAGNVKGTAYKPTGLMVDGNGYTGTVTLGGKDVTATDDAALGEKLVMSAPTGFTAYCSFAQYAIIDKVDIHLNATSLLSFTGQDLLVIHDIYGVGKYGLDVISNTLFNSQDYETRVATSIVATTHVVSLSMWFEAGTSHALLLSAHAYSPVKCSVQFKNLSAIIQNNILSTETTLTGAAVSDADFKAAFIYDSYYMSAAEKEIIANTSATVPYRKTVKSTLTGSNQGAVQNLNFNFVGGDVIAYAVDKTKNCCGKTGQLGVNDSQRPFLNAMKVSINHNECAEVNHATSKWHSLMGGSHLPSLNALYFTPAPGMDLAHVKNNTPFATIPWSRLESAGLVYELDLPTFTDAPTAENIDVHVLSHVYSALARGNGVANQVYS